MTETVPTRPLMIRRANGAWRPAPRRLLQPAPIDRKSPTLEELAGLITGLIATLPSADRWRLISLIRREREMMTDCRLQ